jgi:hypothetical protein
VSVSILFCIIILSQANDDALTCPFTSSSACGSLVFIPTHHPELLSKGALMRNCLGLVPLNSFKLSLFHIKVLLSYTFAFIHPAKLYAALLIILLNPPPINEYDQLVIILPDHHQINQYPHHTI